MHMYTYTYMYIHMCKKWHVLHKGISSSDTVHVVVVSHIIYSSTARQTHLQRDRVLCQTRCVCSLLMRANKLETAVFPWILLVCLAPLRVFHACTCTMCVFRNNEKSKRALASSTTCTNVVAEPAKIRKRKSLHIIALLCLDLYNVYVQGFI